MIAAGLLDPDETVRQVAIHAVSLRRDQEAVPALILLLHNPSLHNRRAAAEALGRIGDRAAVPELLKALGELSAPDRTLEHSLTYALIEIGDPRGHGRRAAQRGLPDPARGPDRTRSDERRRSRSRAGRGALDRQRPRSERDRLMDHWPSSGVGGALAGFFRDRLIKGKLTAADQAELERQLARFAAAPAIQSLLAGRIADASTPAPVKLSSLKAMAQSGLKDVPSSWIEGLAKCSVGDDSELTAQAIATARALPLTRENAGALTPRLLAIAGRAQAPAGLSTGGAGRSSRRAEPGRAGCLLFPAWSARPRAAGCRPDHGRRCAGSSQVDPYATGQRLADALKNAGPLEADRLLTALEQSTDETLGLRLVKNLGESSALSQPPDRRAQATPGEIRCTGPERRPGALRPAQRRHRQAEGTD